MLINYSGRGPARRRGLREGRALKVINDSGFHLRSNYPCCVLHRTAHTVEVLV